MKYIPLVLLSVVLAINAYGAVADPIGPHEKCFQKQIIGNNWFGEQMERVCNKFSDNSFNNNINQIIDILNDPVEGINPATPNGASRAVLQYMIQCVAQDYNATGKSAVSTMDCKSKCDQLVSDKYIDACTSDAITNRVEWKLFRRLVKGFATSDYETSIPTLLDNAIFMWSPEEILRYKLGEVGGCNARAVAFSYLARSVGLDVRYVACVNKKDYKEVCPYKGAASEPGHMNGHQVIAIKFPDNVWRIVDPASRIDVNNGGKAPNPVTYDGTNVLTVTDPQDFVGKEAYFFLDKPTYIITAVEDGKFFDHLNDRTALSLRNIYISGSADNGKICAY